MKIEVLDLPKLIAVNKLEEVTSHHLFSNKMIYDPNGILSAEIFGESRGDRKTTFAWIDLRRKFIHPHIYQKILKQGLFRNIIYLSAGQKRFSVKNGLIVEDPDGWTGLDSLYEHWNEIDWSKHPSSNKLNKDVLDNLTREQVFITKMIVIPPAYRDVMLSGTVDHSDHVNELNDMYTKLIRSVSLLSEGGLFARTQYATQSKIQELLVDIYNYFKGLISKKQGLIKKSLMGKKIDYGVRSVISAFSYNNESIEDNMVDYDHTAVPIYQCCSLFYPFIESWVKNFFTREILNDPNLISFYDNNLKKEITATMKDVEIQFSEKKIRKMINDYMLNPDNRFKVISVQVEVPDGKNTVTEAQMVLKGKQILPNTIKELKRPMTITDVLYLACVDVCEKRHIMVSRYPVGTDKGIYFNNIRVQSTTTHIKLIFNGKEYKYYPDIDINTPQDKVGVKFIDTLVLSNAHLDGMGADFDGDMTSVRGLYSDEANLEAEKIMNSKMNALNITGTNSKVVAKEVFNTMFELTKEGENPKHISELLTKEYLDMKPNDFTRSKLIEMFADIGKKDDNGKASKIKNKHNAWDIIDIPAGYFYDKQPEIRTTIGRFVLNKFVFEGAGIIEVLGYQNKVFNKKYLGFIDNEIGRLYMEDKIERSNFVAYIDRRDHIGYTLNGFLAHTISEKMLKPLPEVEKKKAELVKKYEKEIAEGNIDVMTQISDELIAYAKEILKDDPGMDLYDSGDLDFGNNYKNNYILKGAVFNKITGKFDFIENSLLDGIEIKDIPAHANGILASQYPASIATADAGYLGKKLLALLQMMELDEPDSDCGTKNLIPITVTKNNKDNLLYTYIDGGDGQLVMLDNSNISSYIGKRVRMRSPMSCKGDKICSKCAGKLFYLLGIKHAGLFAVQISHADLNLALKAKHNSVVDVYRFNPDDLILDIE